MAERARREHGFSTLEAIVCVAVVALGIIVALALLPVLVRSSNAAIVRDGATEIGRNVLVRESAGAAYFRPSDMLTPAARATATQNHAWVLGTTTFASAVVLEHAYCAAATTTVPVSVTSTYDSGADRIDVVVSYPSNPCSTTLDASVTLSALVPLSSYVPQTVVQTPIDDPAYQ